MTRILSKRSETLRHSLNDLSLSPCPHCGATSTRTGAGKRPGEESRRCENCKHFLGYSPVSRLKKSRKRKELTKYLQIPENQSIQNELALFTFSLAPENGGEG